MAENKHGVSRISHFDNEWRFLSNFEGPPVVYGMLQYRTVEHGYQASKSLDSKIRREFLEEDLTPGGAKSRGNLLSLRPDWDTVRLPIMEILVRQKFLDRSYLGRLLSTEQLELVEGNYWHDQFWGNCTCPKHVAVEGENHLGKILMKIRAEMQNFRMCYE